MPKDASERLFMNASLNTKSELKDSLYLILFDTTVSIYTNSKIKFHFDTESILISYLCTVYKINWITNYSFGDSTILNNFPLKFLSNQLSWLYLNVYMNRESTEEGVLSN